MADTRDQLVEKIKAQLAELAQRDSSGPWEECAQRLDTAFVPKCMCRDGDDHVLYLLGNDATKPSMLCKLAPQYNNYIDNYGQVLQAADFHAVLDRILEKYDGEFLVTLNTVMNGHTTESSLEDLQVWHSQLNQHLIKFKRESAAITIEAVKTTLTELLKHRSADDVLQLLQAALPQE